MFRLATRRGASTRISLGAAHHAWAPADARMTRPHPGGQGRRTPFRADLEGMRAVAIVAVVLYHAQVGGLSGGYVGVDVFFVLSGFLITGLLWRQLVETGTIGFADFYARRVRRLLPASALVIVATVVMASLAASPLQARPVMVDALSAAVYVANYRFAVQGTNYLSSSAPPSPLQHYWSLGVEEQFYLLWPVLLLAGSLAWRRSSRRGPPSLAAALLVLTGAAAASFTASLLLTRASQPWAFFSLPTRAWELAAGGLVALGAEALRRVPGPVAAPLGWAGAAALAWAVVGFRSSTPFPGTAALLPVLGTVGVLVAGCVPGARGPVLVLKTSVFQLLGRLSYPWYLWHWPVLILTPYLLGKAPGPVGRLAAAGVSLLLAVLTARVVERPARFSPFLARSTSRSLALGGALTGVAALAALLVGSALPAVVGHGLAPVARLPLPVALPPAGPAPARQPGVAAADPLAGARAARKAADAAVAAAIGRSLSVPGVPANLDPALSQAHASLPTPSVDGCFNDFADAGVHPCLYGDLASARTVVVFGDSHATMWFPAFDALAKHNGWRLEALGKGTCPPVNAPLFSPELGRPFYECEQWRTAVLARIRTEHPAVVVLDATRNYGGPYRLASYSQPWLQGLSGMVTDIANTGAQVLVMGPVPIPVTDVAYCLAAHLTDALSCALPAATTINPAGIAAEQRVVAAVGGRYIDTRPWFCLAGTCPAIVDNLLVYRDISHITVPYATYLAAPLNAQLLLDTGGVF